MQGDIIAILDSTGAIVVQYVYDAWGVGLALDPNGNEITSLTHIGQLNPFRYRGYFYDVETGLYYLKSRYYDPTTGRFINMDSISLLGKNAMKNSGAQVYRVFSKAEKKNKAFKISLDFANDFGFEMVQRLTNN